MSFQRIGKTEKQRHSSHDDDDNDDGEEKKVIEIASLNISCVFSILHHH
jgi:hypothetical protein